MDEETGAITTDAPEDFDVENAFLSNLNGDAEKKRLPEGEENGTPAKGEETPKDDEENGSEKPEAETTTDTDTPSPEDAELEVKVGEETHKVKVKDLTRLYGQEAALTRKSQEVAALRATADAEASRATAALKGAIDRANERWRPYAEIDFLVLAQQVDAPTLQQIRQDAQAAANDVRFYTEELTGLEKATKDAATQQHNAEAQATIKELTDPDKGIKGFGPDMYRELVGYAIQQGMPAERANAVTNAAALRMMHKAMMFDRQTTSAAEKVERVINKASKVVKPGSGSQSGNRSQNDAMARLRKSGTTDDAADAFLSRMRD